MDNRICKGRFLSIVFLSLLCGLPLCAQNKAAKTVKGAKKTAKVDSVKTTVKRVDVDRVFVDDERNAMFIGGDEALVRWLAQNLKYPSICQEQNVQGPVYASFVVQEDGSVGDVKIMMSPDPAMSKEVERVLKIMPRWVPAVKYGKPTCMKFACPVIFQILGESKVEVPTEVAGIKLEDLAGKDTKRLSAIQICVEKKEELVIPDFSVRFVNRDAKKKAIKDSMESKAVDEARIFEVNEQNPIFPGGDEAYLAFLAKNIKYPETSRDNDVQGLAYVSFIVEKDGSIDDIKTILSPDSAISKEVERVLKIMPRWTPGKHNGKPVRVKYTTPIVFQIQGNPAVDILAELNARGMKTEDYNGIMDAKHFSAIHIRVEKKVKP